MDIQKKLIIGLFISISMSEITCMDRDVRREMDNAAKSDVRQVRPEAEDRQDSACPICLENLTKSSAVIGTSCHRGPGKKFCLDCLLPAIAEGTMSRKKKIRSESGEEAEIDFIACPTCTKPIIIQDPIMYNEGREIVWEATKAKIVVSKEDFPKIAQLRSFKNVGIDSSSILNHRRVPMPKPLPTPAMKNHETIGIGDVADTLSAAERAYNMRPPVYNPRVQPQRVQPQPRGINAIPAIPQQAGAEEFEDPLFDLDFDHPIDAHDADEYEIIETPEGPIEVPRGFLLPAEPVPAEPVPTAATTQTQPGHRNIDPLPEENHPPLRRPEIPLHHPAVGIEPQVAPVVQPAPIPQSVDVADQKNTITSGSGAFAGFMLGMLVSGELNRLSEDKTPSIQRRALYLPAAVGARSLLGADSSWNGKSMISTGLGFIAGMALPQLMKKKRVQQS